jgi:hypothetical protein
VVRVNDQDFEAQRRARQREHNRRARLASRVDAQTLERRVAERAGTRPSGPPQTASGRDLPATAKQLGLLRALADETRTTFTWPQTRGEAMNEIARMKALAPGRRVRKRSRARRNPSTIR